MGTSGRLAAILNGIVMSSLTGCGGAAEGNQLPAGGQGVGGDAVSGGGSNESGGAGGRQMAGSSSGGALVITAGGSSGSGGIGIGGNGGNGAGGEVSKVSMPLCGEQGLVHFVEGLKLPEPVDYLGIHLNQSADNGMVYRSTGTPCAGASDEAACQAALVAGAPSTGFPALYLYPPVPSALPSYTYMYVAYTRGDSVGFIVDRAQLNAFLGEIDTPNEAGLVFLSMGVGPACNAISETASGYYYVTPPASFPCSTTPPAHAFSVTRAGEVTSTPVGMAMPCVGRRPVGLLGESGPSVSPLGDYYASVAYLEGAAVLAFDVMQRELRRFGAPPELQLRAQQARADEERHQRQMAAMAEREGNNTPHAVRALAAPCDRSLLAAALENAVEGCVREAWGALSAHYQAANAAEPQARLLWSKIAKEESEHAELSLALHDWYMQQLALDERQLVDTAMQRARLELRSELAFGTAPHPTVAAQAGVPTPARAAALFAELERELYFAGQAALGSVASRC